MKRFFELKCESGFWFYADEFESGVVLFTETDSENTNFYRERFNSKRELLEYLLDRGFTREVIKQHAK